MIQHYLKWSPDVDIWHCRKQCPKQNFQRGRLIISDLIAAEPHFLRSTTVLRRPDVCLLRARPLSVPKNSGDSGRGARIFLDHTNPAPTVMEVFVPGLCLALGSGGLQCEMCCLSHAWCGIPVPYYLGGLRGATYSFWASISHLGNETIYVTFLPEN